MLRALVRSIFGKVVVWGACSTRVLRTPCMLSSRARIIPTGPAPEMSTSRRTEGSMCTPTSGASVPPGPAPVVAPDSALMPLLPEVVEAPLRVCDAAHPWTVKLYVISVNVCDGHGDPGLHLDARSAPPRRAELRHGGDADPEQPTTSVP